jgi:hypothetical protein
VAALGVAALKAHQWCDLSVCLKAYPDTNLATAFHHDFRDKNIVTKSRDGFRERDLRLTARLAPTLSLKARRNCE